MALVVPEKTFELNADAFIGKVTGRRQIIRFPEVSRNENFVALYELSKVGLPPVYYCYGEVNGETYCSDPDLGYPEKNLEEAVVEFNNFFNSPPTL